MSNGAVELYHDNVKTLETNNTGVTITGHTGDTTRLIVTGSEDRSAEIQLRADENDDFTDTVRLHQSTNGSLYIQNNTASGVHETMIQANPNGAVELYHDNARKLHTTSTGVLITCQGTDIAIGGNDSIYRTASNMGGIHFSTESVLPANNSGSVVNNSIDLGSSSYRWRNIYTNDLNLSNEGSSNDVDGTWGDWTIQEGESDLFLKNNRSGKKYKFNLTEVS
jgi:hypothetical protein